ncbi:MAG TPA: hypothetical protein VFV99_22930 [Kofleriaceae bacterium]|nr:hypothetical protein [Kofleriaceae bacterium]
MMFLPGLAVIFAGLLGGHGDVDKQVANVLSDLHVKTVKLPAASLQKLTHKDDETDDVVRSLDADGVIACEVVKGALRVWIYDHNGKLKTFSEVPLTKKGLTRDAMDALRSNLGADIATMRGGKSEVADSPAPAKPAKPIVVAKREKPVAKPAAKQSEADVVASDIDDDDPLAPKKAVRKPAPEPSPAAKETAAVDDAGSSDEIDALTAEQTDAKPAPATRSLRFGASAGIGAVSRSFKPGSSGVLRYSNTPVPAVALDAYVQPMRRLTLSIGGERSLQLTTTMRDGTKVPTTISQWEAGGTYAFVHRPRVDLGVHVGAGGRAFAIDTMDPARSPDGDYTYLIAGIDAAAHLGSRVTLRTIAAYEPVVSGTAPTEMASGDARGSALEVSGVIEVRAASHVFVRAMAQYQRFSWSWDTGHASDQYPSGAIALGADY